MLTIESLEAGYGLSRALDGIDLEVPDAQLVAILGRNGMGKTTLCRSIMSLSPPIVWRGAITYDDTELTRLSPMLLDYPQHRSDHPAIDLVQQHLVFQRR